MSELPFGEYLSDRSFHEAKALYRIATQAFERTKSFGGERDAGQADALIAVVFAAAALEAFINQIADLASKLSADEDRSSDALRRYALLAAELEGDKRATELKYQLLSIELSGKKIERGRKPHQDFVLLFRLRDGLVHLKNQATGTPSTVPGSPIRYPGLIDDLRSRNVTAEDIPEGVRVPWIDLICTRAMARWACNTASQVVQAVIEIAPPGDFRTIVLVTSVVGFPEVA